jgi:hypothetical protein
VARAVVVEVHEGGLEDVDVELERAEGVGPTSRGRAGLENIHEALDDIAAVSIESRAHARVDEATRGVDDSLEARCITVGRCLHASASELERGLVGAPGSIVEVSIRPGDVRGDDGAPDRGGEVSHRGVGGRLP